MAEGGRHLNSDSGQQPSRKARRQQAERLEQMQWQDETPRRRTQPAQQGTPQRRTQQPAQQDMPRRRVQQPAQQDMPRRRPRPAEETWREDIPPRTRPVDRAVVAPDDYRQKRRRLDKQSILLIVLVVILAGGVLFAGGKLASIFLNYRRDRSAYDDLANAAIGALAERDEATGPVESETFGETPTESGAPISADWDYLHGVNSEIIGWLYCEGTPINYPVMQTVDNDFYLHRSYLKQENTAGSLFADPDSVVGVSLSNFIVYGHNMKDGSMFATVENYIDQSFYEQHPVMWLLTPYGDYRIELIAGHIVESSLDNYPTYFDGDGGYQNYLYNITSHSTFSTHAQVSTQYQLITMSTCDYSSNFNDPRYLLHGLLVPVSGNSGTDDSAE